MQSNIFENAKGRQPTAQETTSEVAYAKRHPGRDARADGCLAIIFASQTELQRLDRATARSLYDHDRVDVEPIPEWVARGAAERFFLNVQALPSFEGIKLDHQRPAIVTIERLAIAILPELRAASAGNELVAYANQVVRDFERAALDPKRVRLRKGLNLAQRASERCNNIADLADDKDAIAVTFDIGAAMLLRSVCCDLGRIVSASRRGRRGAPIDEINIALLRGVLLHFLVHDFKAPTATDLADLAIYWGTEDDDDRGSLIDRWKTRLRSPWANDVAREVREWGERIDSALAATDGKEIASDR